MADPVPVRISVADLEGCRATGAVHLKLQGGFAWIYNLEGLPRLQVYDRRIKGQRTLTWLVDGEGYDSLEGAIAAYNGDPMPQQTPEKFSIGQQIEEVERELELRRGVYPRQVQRGTMKQSHADYHIKRMEAVLESLKWLKENRPHIIEWIKNRPAKQSAVQQS